MDTTPTRRPLRRPADDLGVGDRLAQEGLLVGLVVLVAFLLDAEGVAEHGRVADQEAAQLVWLEQPLVRIEGDGVGAPQARQAGAAALGDDGRRAVRAVDVEPEAFAGADVGQRNERITRGEPVGSVRGEVDPERSGWRVLLVPGCGGDVVGRNAIAQLLAEVGKKRARSDERRGDEETGGTHPPPSGLREGRARECG